MSDGANTNISYDCIQLGKPRPFDFRPYPRYACDTRGKPWADAAFIAPTAYNMSQFRVQTADLLLAPGATLQMPPNQGPTNPFGHNTDIRCINCPQ